MFLRFLLVSGLMVMCMVLGGMRLLKVGVLWNFLSIFSVYLGGRLVMLVMWFVFSLCLLLLWYIV